jgi:FixJ family two-component response regulator
VPIQVEILVPEIIFAVGRLWAMDDMATRPHSVAIVEDDPSVRKSLKRLLNAYGFTTEGYASAEAFLDAGAERRTACLVLDIHLEGMSGIELRQQLTASGSTLPVIFMTAVDEKIIEQDALQAGCVAYLRKPFPAELLVGAVNKALVISSGVRGAPVGGRCVSGLF